MTRLAWSVLFVAGLFEVVWAVGLEYTDGFSRLGPSVATLAAMAVSVYLLSRAIVALPVGTAYAVWTGIGVVGTALAGLLLFGESREPARLAFICLVVVGIAGLRLTGAR